MEYQIALLPELGVSGEAFVRIWNAKPECHALGEVRPSTQTNTQYGLDPIILVTLSTVSGILLNMAANAFYDALMAVLLEQNVDRPEEVEHVDISFPDGTHIIMVRYVRE